MAVPKRRHSNARTGKRRAHDAKKPRHLQHCPQCTTAVPAAHRLPEMRALTWAPQKSSRYRVAIEGIPLGRSPSILPAQGAQTVGMGRGCRIIACRAAALRSAAEVVGYDLAKLCFEGPADMLDSTIYSQPALCRHQPGGLGVAPRGVARGGPGLRSGRRPESWRIHGYGLRGIMEFEDGLMLVQKRGAAMQEASDATPSGMVQHPGARAGTGRGPVREGPRRRDPPDRQLSLPCQYRDFRDEWGLRAGRRDGPIVRGDEGRAAGRGRGVHTPIMRPADQRCAEVLAEVPMRRPNIPVIFNVDAVPHDDPEEIRRLMVRQILQPVRWKTRCDTCSSRASTSSTKSSRPGVARTAAPHRPQGRVSERRSVTGRTFSDSFQVLTEYTLMGPTKSRLTVDLSGRPAIVTGAARGLGRCIAMGPCPPPGRRWRASISIPRHCPTRFRRSATAGGC